MDAPITLKEVTAAIISLTKKKRPGPDGFPAIYYQIYPELLAHLLLSALNTLREPGSFNRDFLTAIISMIPKPYDLE